jgi:hypothetical protein
MTRLERCELLIKRGYTYDCETGLVYNRFGRVISRKVNGYTKIAILLNNIQFDLYAHHFAWYWVNKECVLELDHINRIKTDNRICNLRSVSSQQNKWNMNAKGCDFYKNKWRARIKANNKEIHLGTFNTEEEAHKAYLAAKKIYHVI